MENNTNSKTSKQHEVNDGVHVNHKQEDQRAVKGSIRIQQTKFNGPLPSPEMMKQYEGILPGAADRIVTMAEKQSEHRQEMEKIVTKAETRDSLLGVLSGFLLGVLMIGGGIYLAIIGHSYGSWLSIGGFASLIGVFVYGTRLNHKANQTDKK